MKVILLAALILLYGMVVYGRHNAGGYLRWRTKQELATYSIRQAQHSVLKAEYAYDNCLMREMPQGDADEMCREYRMDLDAARNDREWAWRRFEALPPAPHVYFPGIFLRSYSDRPLFL